MSETYMLAITEPDTNDIFGAQISSFDVQVPMGRSVSKVFVGNKVSPKMSKQTSKMVEVISLSDFKKFVLPKLDGYVKQKQLKLDRQFKKIKNAQNLESQISKIREILTIDLNSETKIQHIKELLKRIK